MEIKKSIGVIRGLLVVLLVVTAFSSWTNNIQQAKAASFIYVQSNSALADGSATTLSTSLTNVTAGSLIVAYVKWEGSSAGTLTFSDGTSSFTGDTLNSASNGDLHGRFFYLLSSSGSGNRTYTATWSAGKVFRRVMVFQYTYTGTLSFDVSARGQAASGTLSSGNMTTTGNDEVAFGAYGEYDSSMTANEQINGQVADQVLRNSISMWSKTFNSAFTGAATATGNSAEWIGNAIAFKTSGGQGGDVTPPTISISSPSNGATISGTTTITVNASDNIGLAGVQFKIDGNNLGAEDTSAPYTASWDTTSVSNASHNVTAVARDTSNNTATSAAVSVTVNNAVAPPPPPPPPGPTPPPGPPGSLIPTIRLTNWNPGLNAVGGIPNRTTVCATVNASTYGNGSQDATGGIQTAINNCPVGQVVQLSAGTFKIAVDPININKGITLRGAGSTATILTKPLGTQSSVVDLGRKWVSYGNSTNLTSDAAKEATSVTVASTAGLSVGQLVMIDELPDAARTWFANPECLKGSDCRKWGFIRYDAAANDGRPISQMMEIGNISGNTITFTTGFHLSFRVSKTAQLTQFSQAAVTYAGLEDLKVQNGQGGDGGGNAYMELCGYCWIKNIESFNSHGGSVSMWKDFRSVVRDSYIHGTQEMEPGGGGYGISINNGTSDMLIENNISAQFNKVMVMRGAGGGNVIAYNYADDGAGLSYGTIVESGLNASHYTTPHYELFEGNEAFNLDGEVRWGNSIDITWFRNHATMIRRNLTNLGIKDCFNRRAVSVQAKHLDYSFVGNVLGTAGMALVTGCTETQGPFVYEAWDPWNTPAIWSLGHGDPANATAGVPNPDPNVALTTIRNGNFDYVTNSVRWDTAAQTIPDSLYLSSKPAFFGGNVWPWVDPIGSTKLYTLPARQRYDSLMGGDVIPPTVSITAPSNGATVLGTSVTLSASASDNNAVSSVQFRVDGANVGSADTTTPYSITWNSQLVANGAHTITAVATDLGGLTATSSGISVTVNNPVDSQAPTVPTNLAATAISSSQINLTWTASTDNVSVAGYKIFRAGTQVGTSVTNSFSNTGLTASTAYSYTVSANDPTGNNSAQSSQASATTLVAQTGCLTSTGSFQNTAFASQSASFTIAFDLTPGQDQMDGVVGFASAAVADYPTLSGAIRLNPSGTFDAINGATNYTALTSVPYTGGAIYHIRMVIDPVSDTYAVYVTPPSGSEVQIASNYPFRVTATALTTRAMISQTASENVCNFTLSAGASDTTPPTAALTAPANNATVSGASTTVSATATDNVGVVGVQFKIDGNNLSAEDTTSPYSITWNTTSTPNGSHSLTAVSRDAANNITTSAARTVTVSNSLPNQVPVGAFDEIRLSDGVIRGWTYDPDAATTSNALHIYINGAAGAGGTLLNGAPTDILRTDVNTSFGITGNHGVEFTIPAQYRDGVQHAVYLYGIDTSNAAISTLLTGSPKNFTLTSTPTTYQRTISIASLDGRSSKVVTGTIDVLSNPAKTLIKSYSYTTNSSGAATITFDITAQVVYLKVKATPFVTRLVSADLNNNITYSIPQLVIGDINQDNIINSIDFSALNSKWFTADAVSDLNQDGIVNSLDFSLLNKNWFVAGEQ